MAIKIYKPTSDGRRHSSVQSFSDITKKKPEKSLIVHLTPNAGRNNQGVITVRHQGSGVKQFYRLVDFKLQKFDSEATVLAIEYDPNRGPRIALVQYADGTKAYVLAPEGLKVGEKITSSQKLIEAKTGNRMPLQFIPVGMFIHNLELTPGKGGQLVRGAGLAAQLVGKEEGYALVKLPSGEVRKILQECAATIGSMGNPDYGLIRWGKAGRSRMRGIRPRVNGKNMNPVDHPHGGGDGGRHGSGKAPRTPWGQLTLGYRTRRRKDVGKLIVKTRHEAKRKR